MAVFIALAASTLTLALKGAAPTPAYGPQTAKASYTPIPAVQTIDSGYKTVAPGTVRPASYDAHQPVNEPEGRGFACVDRKCKTVSPVYNTGTPLHRERGRLAEN